MTAPRLLGWVGVEEGSGSPRTAAVADLALPARALAFSPVRAGAPVDDHLDVRVGLVVLGQLVEELVCELGWDDAVDHRALRRILGTRSANARGLGGMALGVGVRCSFPGNAGSARIDSDTGATEDAVLEASSSARRHSRYFAENLLQARDLRDDPAVRLDPRVPGLEGAVQVSELVAARLELHRLRRLRRDAVLVPGDVPGDRDQELLVHARQREDARAGLAETLGHAADRAAVVARVVEVGGLDRLELGLAQPAEDGLGRDGLLGS